MSKDIKIDEKSLTFADENSDTTVDITWTQYDRPVDVGMSDWFDGTSLEVKKKYTRYDETIAVIDVTPGKTKVYGVRRYELAALEELYNARGINDVVDTIERTFELITSYK
jgi:hypothetical protein